MAIVLQGLEQQGPDPEIYGDRRGYGLRFRRSVSGPIAGEFVCLTAGTASYTVFKTWTDLPKGSLMRAPDRNGALYELNSQGIWVPQGGQFTGMFPFSASRELTSDDNGSILVTQATNANRNATITTTLPLSFFCQFLQGNVGTITVVAPNGVTLLGASATTGGPGKVMNLRRVDATTYITY